MMGQHSTQPAAGGSMQFHPATRPRPVPAGLAFPAAPASTSGQLVPATTSGAAFRRPAWLPARSLAARVSPVILPTAVMAAARWWHAEGAAHSVGDMFIPGLFAAGALFVGWISASNGDRLTKGAALGFSVAGTLAAAGVVAYSGGMALPALLWTVAAGLAVKLSSLAHAAEARHKRRLAEREAQAVAEAARREHEARQRHDDRMQREQLRARTAVTQSALDVFGRVAVAELEAASRVAVAELEAGTAHAALPGMDRTALPEQHGRRELAAFLGGATAEPVAAQDEDDWLLPVR